MSDDDDNESSSEGDGSNDSSTEPDAYDDIGSEANAGDEIPSHSLRGRGAITGNSWLRPASRVGWIRLAYVASLAWIVGATLFGQVPSWVNIGLLLALAVQAVTIVWAFFLSWRLALVFVIGLAVVLALGVPAY